MSYDRLMAVRGELPNVKCHFQCDYVILGLLGTLGPPARLENTWSQRLKLALSVLFGSQLSI